MSTIVLWTDDYLPFDMYCMNDFLVKDIVLLILNEANKNVDNEGMLLPNIFSTRSRVRMYNACMLCV